MAVKFTGSRLDIGARIVDSDGRPTPKFQRDWQALVAAIGDTVAQINAALQLLADQQTQLDAQQTQLAATVTAQGALLARVLRMLAGTEVFTGLNVDSKRVDNFFGALDNAGFQIVDAAVTPLNYPSGAARSYDVFPLTSDASSISVGAVGYDQPGSAGVLTSGSVTGLASDTIYRVFYNPGGNFYTAQQPPAGIYFSSTDGWQFIGDIKTELSGGGYSPSPSPPDGFDPGFYSGGMNVYDY